MLLYWWENKSQFGDEELVIKCRNNKKVKLLPLLNATTVRYQKKNLSNILRSVGDGDLVSGAEKMMSVCQSAIFIESSDNKILEHIHQFKIPAMAQAETLSLWNDYLLSRDKIYLLGSYIQQHVGSWISPPP